MSFKKTFGQISPGLLLAPLIILNLWCALRVYSLAHQRAEIKNDYGTVNDITYGLLNVNAWRDDIMQIVADRIHDFKLTPDQEADLKVEISKVLNALITQADSTIQHEKSFGGQVTKIAVNTFVNWDDVRKKVPIFTQTIINEIQKPSNKEKLKDFVQEKVNEYAAQTYDSTMDTTHITKILAKYNVPTVSDFNQKSAGLIDSLQVETYNLVFIMVGSLVFFLLLWFFVFKYKQLRAPLFIMCVMLALIVLLTALFSPMIEIDARIKKLDFVLLGEHLQFNNQVIFFQSKSIIDVVRILLKTGKADSILVGALILVFSILFPISKLISTEVYLIGNEKIKKNKIIYFFAFKSGKWSMADVSVVAIFMAYVGFKNILNNQLQHLNVNTESLTSIATNLTSLQPGFILFISFVLFGLVLSEILHRITEVPSRKLFRAAPQRKVAARR
jgi:Paraquat-inducible protein A